MTTNVPAIIPADNGGAALYRVSTDAAAICKELVVRTSQPIQGRNYVRVEGWQAIAIAHGCVASSGDVERTDDGFRAIGRVIRMDTGIVIASAEGFVGKDEPTWFGGEVVTKYGKKVLPKRPDYAIRAMAQTRAISRACRSAFAHVVVMMNAGLSTTPAEEMDGMADAEAKPAARNGSALDNFDAAPATPPPYTPELKATAKKLFRALTAAKTVSECNDLMTAGVADVERLKAASADDYEQLMERAMARERALAADETVPA